jgi:predicted DNA-binding transcriptional regulator
MRLTERSPFYIDKPLFVRKRFTALGKSYALDEEFAWKERNVKDYRVAMLYKQGFLKHDDNLVSERIIGDGLDALTPEELDAVVESINEDVASATQNITEFNRKKCKKSKIKNKQIALIRQWRGTFGHLET